MLMMDLNTLNKQIDAAEKEKKEIERKLAKLLASRERLFRKIAAEHGYTIRREARVGRKQLPVRKARRALDPVPVKYRHGSDKWTGRGVTPLWLRKLESEGRTREEFKV